MLPRIQSFVWLYYHDSIEVKEWLNQRGMLLNTQCPLCHTCSELIINVFRDRRMVKHVWDQLGENRVNMSFFNGNLQE